MEYNVKSHSFDDSISIKVEIIRGADYLQNKKYL